MNATSRSALALTLLAAVTACNGSAPSENVAAPEANELALDNIMIADPSNSFDEAQPAPAATATPAPTKAAPEPTPKPKAAPEPKADTPKAPTPAPDPHAGHDMNNMSH